MGPAKAVHGDERVRCRHLSARYAVEEGGECRQLPYRYTIEGGVWYRQVSERHTIKEGAAMEVYSADVLQCPVRSLAHKR